MPKQGYWAEEQMALVRAQLAATKETMALAIRRPVLRRPNTSAILEAALRGEAPPTGRESLGQMLRDTYGEATAKILYPHLGLDENGAEELADAYEQEPELGPPGPTAAGFPG